MKIDKISALVQAQFPDFFKEDGQNFLSFMEAYYAYMETDGGATDAVRKLESYRDIASTTEELIIFSILFSPQCQWKFLVIKSLWRNTSKNLINQEEPSLLIS